MSPYFDMRLGRMVHGAQARLVPPNPCRPGMPCAAQPALGQNGGGAGKALLWLALLAVGGYGAYYLYKKSREDEDFEPERDDRDDDRDDESGYWVKLYNYPRGNRDRRLKSVEGPFETRSEAEEVARQNEDVWYPAVAWSRQSPLETER